MIYGSPVFAIVALIMEAFVGAGVGALSGWVASLMMRTSPKGVLKDGILGWFGYVVGIVGSNSMPWPRNTITYQLEGGAQVTSTMNTYQHPERIAIVVAIVLPILHELYRLKRARAKVSK